MVPWKIMDVTPFFVHLKNTTIMGVRPGQIPSVRAVLTSTMRFSLAPPSAFPATTKVNRKF
eukprot:3371445-Ditylum_brightwellii.AAC.1